MGIRWVPSDPFLLRKSGRLSIFTKSAQRDVPFDIIGGGGGGGGGYPFLGEKSTGTKN